jgi:hypothetical protein
LLVAASFLLVWHRHTMAAAAAAATASSALDQVRQILLRTTPGGGDGLAAWRDSPARCAVHCCFERCAAGARAHPSPLRLSPRCSVGCADRKGVPEAADGGAGLQEDRGTQGQEGGAAALDPQRWPGLQDARDGRQGAALPSAPHPRSTRRRAAAGSSSAAASNDSAGSAVVLSTACALLRRGSLAARPAPCRARRVPIVAAVAPSPDAGLRVTRR